MRLPLVPRLQNLDDVSEAVDEEAVMRSVLSYFLRNPDAADGAEGIARWRLLEHTIANTVEETTRGLHRLVAERQLIEQTAPGMKPIYRLNPDRPAGSEK